MRTQIVYAGQDTAKAALLGLSSADLVRLDRISRARALGLVGMEARDLLNEAIVRMLDGRRRWPVHVPLAAFLAQVMRSIADEERARLAQRGVLEDIADASIIADERPLPGRALQARQGIAAVMLHFAEDADVLTLISGCEHDESPAETRARTGLDPKRYDAARKRLQRALDRLVESGS